MKKYFIGATLGIGFVIICGFLFVISGAMPVATAGTPLPLERWVAELAIHAAMRGQTDLKPSVLEDEINLLAGAKIYSMNCAVCHGIPKRERSLIAQGLFPKPPALLEKEDAVTDDETGKIYWFVKNGIRLTGMPGFVNRLSETELWQVSLFLKNADKLPASVNSYLDDQAK